MRINKYQVVHSISEVIAKTADPWTGLKKVTKQISEYANNACCSLFAYNRISQTITLVACHEHEDLPNIGNLSFSVNQGLTGIAVRTGKILNIADETQHKENMEGHSPDARVYHGLLIVPLVIGGMTIGAIVLEQTPRRCFSKRIFEMVEEIATPLAMFIINTMLAKQNSDINDVFAIKNATQKAKLVLDRPLRGTPITKGVVTGHAVVISSVDEFLNFKRLPHPVNTTKEAIQAEKELFFAAVEVAKRTCRKTAQQLEQLLSEADCDIFTIHAMLLDDPTIRKNILAHIEDGHSITTSLAAALKTFSAQYMKIEDEYLRERIYDIKDILLNVKDAADNLRHIKPNNRDEYQLLGEKNIIVVAKELLPSQLVALPLRNITGIICEEGGSTSHVAILARALQKTMLVGVNGIADYVAPNDSILLDCNAGLCYLKPNIPLLRQFAESLRVTRDRNRQMRSEDAHGVQDSKTSDGTSVHFAGNIALLSELSAIHHYGLEEIGLYRTEFMFMIRNELPTEAEQFNVLKKMVTGAGHPVNVRLLDAGGDKPLPYMNIWDKEENPSLGWRGLRFMLSHPDILKTQLRAILRASAFGKINILIPMVADLFDFMEVKKAVTEVEQELNDAGIAYDKNYKLGIMLEIPSAISALSDMLPYIDFVSIGTNDLVQFMFAVDRGNPAVRKWYRQLHPVILQAIRKVCKTMAKYPEKSLSICGELAGSKHAFPLLLGAGLRKFSMTPSRIPELRAIVSKWSIQECEKLLDDVLANCHSEMDITAYLDKYNKEHL